jgi:hypothetical protein
MPAKLATTITAAFKMNSGMRAQRLSLLGCFAELIFACLGLPRPQERLGQCPRLS